MSHDLIEINHITNSLAVVIDGKVIQNGMTKEVVNEPNVEAAPFLLNWKELYTI